MTVGGEFNIIYSRKNGKNLPFVVTTDFSSNMKAYHASYNQIPVFAFFSGTYSRGLQIFRTSMSLLFIYFFPFDRCQAAVEFKRQRECAAPHSGGKLNKYSTL